LSFNNARYPRHREAPHARERRAHQGVAVVRARARVLERAQQLACVVQGLRSG
jgi:hypothetical protein